jgi:Arf-GAP with coiled-coil, ANK repeat and PH domain-containing protein
MCASFQIGDMTDETYRIQKELENTHSVVSNIEPIAIKNEKNSPTMEGYLFKRTSNAFKTWNRRWFYLYDNKLVYR